MKRSWIRFLVAHAALLLVLGPIAGLSLAGKPSGSSNFGGHFGSQPTQSNKSSSNIVYKAPIDTAPKFPSNPVLTSPVGGVGTIKLPPNFPTNVGNNGPIVTLPPKFPTGPIITLPPTFPGGKPPIVTLPPKFPTGPIVTLPPTFPGGKPPIITLPPKFPTLPPIVIDPGQPPMQPQPQPQPTPSPIWPVIVGGILNGGFPVGMPNYPTYPVSGGGTTVVYNTTPAAAPVATTQPESIDLELVDLRFVDDGLQAGQGPRYRMTVRNVGRSDSAGLMTVALYATSDGRATNDGPLASTQAACPAIGMAATVDLRLPAVAMANATMMHFLTGVVQPPADVADANLDNNAATYDRSAVAEVPVAMQAIHFDEPGMLAIDGEGFGRDIGKVSLGLGGHEYPADAVTWKPTHLVLRLPAADPTGLAGMSVQLVRADGRTASPVEVKFAK